MGVHGMSPSPRFPLHNLFWRSLSPKLTMEQYQYSFPFTQYISHFFRVTAFWGRKKNQWLIYPKMSTADHFVNPPPLFLKILGYFQMSLTVGLSDWPGKVLLDRTG